MSKLRTIAPDEIDSVSYDDICFPVSTLGLQFGLTKGEVLAELQSGRLIASAPADSKNPLMDAVVPFLALARWMSSGSAAAVKARQFLKDLNQGRSQ